MSQWEHWRLWLCMLGVNSLQCKAHSSVVLLVEFVVVQLWSVTEAVGVLWFLPLMWNQLQTQRSRSLSLSLSPLSLSPLCLSVSLSVSLCLLSLSLSLSLSPLSLSLSLSSPLLSLLSVSLFSLSLSLSLSLSVPVRPYCGKNSDDAVRTARIEKKPVCIRGVCRQPQKITPTYV